MPNTEHPNRTFHKEGSLPLRGEVFVFGSNKAGRHGKGAALTARTKFGAVYGQGEGRQGRSYGIATKDGRPGSPPLADIRATLPLKEIESGVSQFLGYASSHPEERFFIVRIGCQLAGYADSQIAPLFWEAPPNCSFSELWKPWLEPDGPPPATVSALQGNLF